MVVLYAIVCPELNSSGIQYLVGDTFPIDAEIAEMIMPFLQEVLRGAATVSPEPLDIGGCLTTQNVWNGHILGVSNKFSYPKVNGF